MKLFKTEIVNYYYTKTKKGVTYYYNYHDKGLKKSIRKKIVSCDEHNSKNLELSVTLKDDVLKGNIEKQILKETNENFDENLNLNNFTLNEIIDIREKKFYSLKRRQLREHYAGYSDEYFENDTVVKKKLYSIEKRILTYNKNVRNSSIGNMKYKNITKRKLTNWLEKELNPNLSITSKHNIVVFLRASINDMIKQDYISLENVFKKINIKNPRRQRTRVLTTEELELLLLECKKYNKPREQVVKRKDTGSTYIRYLKPNYNIYTSVYLAIITAARTSSLLTIMKKDINLKEKTITLINHKSKNNKYKVPINDEAIEWFKKKLKYYPNDNDYLLQANNDYTRQKVGKGNSLRFIPREVFHIMDRLFNQNIDKSRNLERDFSVNMHSIRRTIATKLAISGMSIYSIKKLLDHTSVDITEKYLNLSHEDYKQDLNVFQNNLFAGFKQLLHHTEIENNNDTNNIEKSDIINQILIKSNNVGNRVVKDSLEILNINELKRKLISYI